jgi:Protein of unknown function (DUF3179)
METRVRPLRILLTAVALAAVLSPAAGAAGTTREEVYALVRQLTSVQGGERKEAARKLLEAPDPTLIPLLVDLLFFTPKLARGEIVEVLKGLSGEDVGDGYYDWVEYVGRRTDLASRPDYMELKVGLFSRIDPTFQKIFYPGAPARIRLEEIVSGGVKLDGIPPLEDPPKVPAAEARFLRDDEQVFGVSLGGKHHAYPHRYLSWHEMVNDVIGGEPITLSY